MYTCALHSIKEEKGIHALKGASIDMTYHRALCCKYLCHRLIAIMRLPTMHETENLQLSGVHLAIFPSSAAETASL
jgi:hypothetical protein